MERASAPDEPMLVSEIASPGWGDASADVEHSLRLGGGESRADSKVGLDSVSMAISADIGFASNHGVFVTGGRGDEFGDDSPEASVQSSRSRRVRDRDGGEKEAKHRRSGIKDLVAVVERASRLDKGASGQVDASSVEDGSDASISHTRGLPSPRSERGRFGAREAWAAEKVTKRHAPWIMHVPNTRFPAFSCVRVRANCLYCPYFSLSSTTSPFLPFSPCLLPHSFALFSLFRLGSRPRCPRCMPR